MPSYRHLEPVTGTRLAVFAQPNFGSAFLRLSGEHSPGEFTESYGEVSFALIEGSSLVCEFPLVRWDDSAGLDGTADKDWKRSASGDHVYSWRQSLLASGAQPGTSSFLPAIASEFAFVDDHGGQRPARIQGLVENEEGFFGRIAAEWPMGGFGGYEATLSLNAGAALLGRAGRPGQGVRYLWGLAFTHALWQPGIQFSTEPLKLSIESFWLEDPIDDRRFGDLGLALELPVGAAAFSFGLRLGLTEETEDLVIFVDFASQLFDALL